MSDEYNDLFNQLFSFPPSVIPQASNLSSFLSHNNDPYQYDSQFGSASEQRKGSGSFDIEPFVDDEAFKSPPHTQQQPQQQQHQSIQTLPNHAQTSTRALPPTVQAVEAVPIGASLQEKPKIDIAKAFDIKQLMVHKPILDIVNGQTPGHGLQHAFDHHPQQFVPSQHQHAPMRFSPYHQQQFQHHQQHQHQQQQFHHQQQHQPLPLVSKQRPKLAFNVAFTPRFDAVEAVAVAAPPSTEPLPVATAEAHHPPAKQDAADANRASVKAKKPKERESLALKRQKHNEVEIRRRQRINNRFMELRELVNCDNTDKRSILHAAIEQLKFYKAKEQLAASASTSASSDDSAAQAPVAEKDAQEVSAKTEPVQGLSVAAGKLDHNQIFNNHSVGLAVATLDGRFIDVNPYFTALTGYDKSEIANTSIFTLTAPEHLSTSFSVLHELLNGQTTCGQLRKKMISRVHGLVEVRCSMWLTKKQNEPQYIMFLIDPVNPVLVAST